VICPIDSARRQIGGALTLEHGDEHPELDSWRQWHLGRLAPEHVAGKMRRAFMTPRTLPPRDWELPLLAAPSASPCASAVGLRWGQGRPCC
jgi:hypothetical protein